MFLKLGMQHRVYKVSINVNLWTDDDAEGRGPEDVSHPVIVLVQVS